MFLLTKAMVTALGVTLVTLMCQMGINRINRDARTRLGTRDCNCTPVSECEGYYSSLRNTNSRKKLQYCGFQGLQRKVCCQWESKEAVGVASIDLDNQYASQAKPSKIDIKSPQAAVPFDAAGSLQINADLKRYRNLDLSPPQAIEAAVEQEDTGKDEGLATESGSHFFEEVASTTVELLSLQAESNEIGHGDHTSQSKSFPESEFSKNSTTQSPLRIIDESAFASDEVVENKQSSLKNESLEQSVTFTSKIKKKTHPVNEKDKLKGHDYINDNAINDGTNDYKFPISTTKANSIITTPVTDMSELVDTTVGPVNSNMDFISATTEGPLEENIELTESWTEPGEIITTISSAASSKPSNEPTTVRSADIFWNNTEMWTNDSNESTTIIATTGVDQAIQTDQNRKEDWEGIDKEDMTKRAYSDNEETNAVVKSSKREKNASEFSISSTISNHKRFNNFQSNIVFSQTKSDAPPPPPTSISKDPDAITKTLTQNKSDTANLSSFGEKQSLKSSSKLMENIDIRSLDGLYRVVNPENDQSIGTTTVFSTTINLDSSNRIEQSIEETTLKINVLGIQEESFELQSNGMQSLDKVGELTQNGSKALHNSKAYMEATEISYLSSSIETTTKGERTEKTNELNAKFSLRKKPENPLHTEKPEKRTTVKDPIKISPKPLFNMNTTEKTSKILSLLKDPHSLDKNSEKASTIIDTFDKGVKNGTTAERSDIDFNHTSPRDLIGKIVLPTETTAFVAPKELLNKSAVEEMKTTFSLNDDEDFPSFYSDLAFGENDPRERAHTSGSVEVDTTTEENDLWEDSTAFQSGNSYKMKVPEELVSTTESAESATIKLRQQEQSGTTKPVESSPKPSVTSDIKVFEESKETVETHRLDASEEKISVESASQNDKNELNAVTKVPKPLIKDAIALKSHASHDDIVDTTTEFYVNTVKYLEVSDDIASNDADQSILEINFDTLPSPNKSALLTERSVIMAAINDTVRSKNKESTFTVTEAMAKVHNNNMTTLNVSSDEATTTEIYTLVTSPYAIHDQDVTTTEELNFMSFTEKIDRTESFTGNFLKTAYSLNETNSSDEKKEWSKLNASLATTDAYSSSTLKKQVTHLDNEKQIEGQRSVEVGKEKEMIISAFTSQPFLAGEVLSKKYSAPKHVFDSTSATLFESTVNAEVPETTDSSFIEEEIFSTTAAEDKDNFKDKRISEENSVWESKDKVNQTTQEIMEPEPTIDSESTWSSIDETTVTPQEIITKLSDKTSEERETTTYKPINSAPALSVPGLVEVVRKTTVHGDDSGISFETSTQSLLQSEDESSHETLRSTTSAELEPKSQVTKSEISSLKFSAETSSMNPTNQDATTMAPPSVDAELADGIASHSANSRSKDFSTLSPLWSNRAKEFLVDSAEPNYTPYTLQPTYHSTISPMPSNKSKENFVTTKFVGTTTEFSVEGNPNHIPTTISYAGNLSGLPEKLANYSTQNSELTDHQSEEISKDSSSILSLPLFTSSFSLGPLYKPTTPPGSSEPEDLNDVFKDLFKPISIYTPKHLKLVKSSKIEQQVPRSNLVLDIKVNPPKPSTIDEKSRAETALEWEISKVVTELLLTSHSNFRLLPTFVECASARLQRGRRKLLRSKVPIYMDNQPWMARIGYKLSGGTIFACAGSVISSRYILTSAFCAKKYINYPISEVLIEAAKYKPSPRKNSELYKIKYGVEEVVCHEKFDNKTFENDIALVRVDQDIPFNSTSTVIRPLCLPFEDGYGIWESLPSPGQNVQLVGWGFAKNHTTADEEDTLKQEKVKLWKNEECSEAFTNTTAKIEITRNQICGSTNFASCASDHGTALVASMTKHRVYFQLGISSYSHGCGNIIPNVYTRVKMYLKWILDHIKE